MFDIAVPFFGSTNRFGTISLADSMACCGLEFEGTAHKASVDAIGTAKMLQFIANQVIDNNEENHS